MLGYEFSAYGFTLTENFHYQFVNITVNMEMLFPFTEINLLNVRKRVFKRPKQLRSPKTLGKVNSVIFLGAKTSLLNICLLTFLKHFSLQCVISISSFHLYICIESLIPSLVPGLYKHLRVLKVKHMLQCVLHQSKIYGNLGTSEDIEDLMHSGNCNSNSKL